MESDKINKMFEGFENVIRLVNPSVPDLMFALSDILCHYAVQTGVPQAEFLKLLAAGYKENEQFKNEQEIKIINREIKDESNTTV